MAGGLSGLADCIDRGLNAVRDVQEQLRQQVEDIRAVSATLDMAKTSVQKGKRKFDSLQVTFSQSADPIRQQMATIMSDWKAGLFTGGVVPDLPSDNLDLERFFKTPKGHQRRVHGRAHAGIRIVREGPTLLLALDAHLAHPRPFEASELIPYRDAPTPTSEQAARQRHKIMRRARSKKGRPALLAELEARYRRLI